MHRKNTGVLPLLLAFLLVLLAAVPVPVAAQPPAPLSALAIRRSHRLVQLSGW